jgi:hypothetical protein
MAVVAGGCGATGWQRSNWYGDLFTLFLHLSLLPVCSISFVAKHTEKGPNRSFFFVYSYSHEAYLDYGGVHFDRFLAAVRAVAARCKLPPMKIVKGNDENGTKQFLTPLPRMP